MTIWNSVVELLATIVECFAWVAVALHFSNALKKENQFWKPILIGGVLDTLLVFLLNQIQLFSFMTVLISIIFYAVFSFLWTRGKPLVCAASAMMTVTVMAAIDYILFFLIGLLSENPVIDARTFMAMMSPGAPRYLYLAAAKATQILLAVFAIRKLPSLAKLPTRYVAWLLLAVSGFYIMMSYLVSMILSSSILVLQTAVILSLIFILACIIVLLAVFFISTDYRAEKETNELLNTLNTLTEENYRRIGDSQKTFAKANHDFRHHLTVIRDLALQGNDEEIPEYADSLLKTAYQPAPICQCGNSVVDAVINCKASEAKAEQINFSYQINLASDIPILSTDICAILANQVDNALDACKRDTETGQKYIKVHIWQQTDRIVVFQVVNSISESPFNAEGALPSTKTDTLHPHGLGIRIIRETAEKYDGTLDNRFQNGEFVSSVNLNFPAETAIL